MGTKNSPAEAPLWTVDFRLFFIARTTSLLGDTMLPVVITAAMIELGYGANGVGYALAAHIAPFAALLIFGGVLSDRFGARRMMAVADGARLFFQTLLALLFFFGTPQLWQIIVLLSLIGAGGAIFQPGVASITPRIAQDVQKANATLRVAESITTIIGPSFAGVLLAVLSPAFVFALDAATFAVSGICILLLRSIPMAAADRDSYSSFRVDLVEGWREFRSRTWLWSVIAIWMVWQVSSFGPTLTLGYSTLVTEHGASVFGLIMSALGIGNLLGGVVAMKLRPRYPLRAGSIAMAAYVLLPLGVALDLSAPLLAVCYTLGGVGMAFWAVMFQTSVQTHVPQEVLGRVHSYDAAGSLVMKPVGQAIAGPIAVITGVVPLLLLSATMGLVVCVLLLAVPAVRNLQRVSR